MTADGMQNHDNSLAIGSTDHAVSFGFQAVDNSMPDATRHTRRCSVAHNVPMTGSLETSSTLHLADGSQHNGISFGAKRAMTGEVVFNTGMVGYPEALTDPSYRGQILVLTYPLVGNYGVPSLDARDEDGLREHFESDDVQVAGLIVCWYSDQYSHWEATMSLGAWLKKRNIPAMFGVDTRALTKRLRTHGSMLGAIAFAGEPPLTLENPFTRNLVAEVSRKEPIILGNGSKTIVCVDCGMKNNIVRYLLKFHDVTLKIVPWDYDFTTEEMDGLFISNGPGDPETVSKTIDHLKVMLTRSPPVPIFGICLGHQLLALAAGAKTYKMKFGHRSMNQPCIDLRTTRCYVTPQNHGFAVDGDSLSKDWQPFFVNANDNSNEGIIHSYLPYFSVQFHPEAMGGPHDTSFLFDLFMERILYRQARITTVPVSPVHEPIYKVLLLGSGGLSIGQAGEFDYSGSQAIKALKEENIHTVLINPNIATVQTGKGMADEVYFLPVTPEFVTQVIEKERPDGILLQFGGQTALNCGILLKDMGILEKYNIRVLGTPIETIRATEDRKLFAEKLDEINECMAPSLIVESIDEALAAGKKIGYPVLVRAAFALGGLGSGFASNEAEMRKLAEIALSSSSQLIIDKSLRGWKEVEYEVVRDQNDNCIAVCNMENFDPLGVHTGDSIVVAPSQTLSNKEYFKLRDVALKTIRHLGVVGECNIQYAVNPGTFEYCIIEVNARLSRSSALASKATGYPLAYVACKLALGKCLPDIKNSVTKTTTACFEPSLDYVVVKIPRWDLKKFTRVSKKIGSAMKSVGEVMAIGRTFEESFQKAVRMIDDSIDGFGDSPSSMDGMTDEEMEEELTHPTDQRIFAIARALVSGRYSVDQLHTITAIDTWFLDKLSCIINVQKSLKDWTGDLWDVPSHLLLLAKQVGCSDRQVGRCMKGMSEPQVRKLRLQRGIRPYVKQIDTLAAEFPAHTNYLYMTYHAVEHDLDFTDRGVIVLGCGAYRIGSSCEFDWCAVSCLRTLKTLGSRSIMINYNPETVSTDYDESDRLYFEELTLERVLDIYELEQARGVIVSVGGQVSNMLALPLHNQGVRVLGTTASSIDTAEDRHKFSALLDSLQVDQPEWKQLTTVDDACQFASGVGYPVLVRPSYVLSGAAMNVAHNRIDLIKYLQSAVSELASDNFSVVISKFISGAKEIEFDAVANGGQIVNFAISEHVENAGVHSGDATLVLPAQKLYVETVRRVKRIAERIAANLNITGPFNIQFLSKDNDIRVIECNLRASRSFPFVSKTFDVNFIDLATRAIVGAHVKAAHIDLNDISHVCIKAPMFSFTRLQGSDPILSVEMASTGEVACFGVDRHEAFLKALFSTGFKMPRRNVLISAGSIQQKADLIPSAEILSGMGFTIFGSDGTADFLQEAGVPCTKLYKPSARLEPSIVEYLREGKIDLVINVSDYTGPDEVTDGYQIRRTAVDFSVALITNIKLAIQFVHAVSKVDNFAVKSWKEYLQL